MRTKQSLALASAGSNDEWSSDAVVRREILDQLDFEALRSLGEKEPPACFRPTLQDAVRVFFLCAILTGMGILIFYL